MGYGLRRTRSELAVFPWIRHSVIQFSCEQGSKFNGHACCFIDHNLGTKMVSAMKKHASSRTFVRLLYLKKILTATKLF